MIIRCSQCLGPVEDVHGFEIYELADRKANAKQALPFWICGLRCMAIWAMQRGWTK